MEQGWHFVRINWQELNNPVVLEARLRAALQRSGAQLPLRRTAIHV